MCKKLFFLVFIFLPPWLATRAIVFPIIVNEPIQESVTASSTPQNDFDAQLENQINRLQQLSIANIGSIVRYDTTLENNSYLSIFDASGTRTSLETSTLVCSNQGIRRNLLFGISTIIATDTDVTDAENVLRNFACVGAEYPIQPNGVWFSLPPHYSAMILNDIPIGAAPTEGSYGLVYIALIGLWTGSLVLTKEMIHLVKDGFKYFLN